MSGCVQLKLSPHNTSLFPPCTKGIPLSPTSNPPICYLLLPYSPFQNTSHNNHICRALGDTARENTLVELEGECFHKWVLRGRKDAGGRIMEEGEIWGLLGGVVDGLRMLAHLGLGHSYTHLKQYCIRRVQCLGGHTYKLLYHQSMTSQLQLANTGVTPWHSLYLSPQQLHQQFVPQKSITFSLGLLLLNLCAHADRGRHVYKKDRFEVDWEVVRWKLAMGRDRGYSRTLMDFVRGCLEGEPEERMDFGGLWQKIRGLGLEKRIKHWQVLADIIQKRSNYHLQLQEQDSPTVVQYKSPRNRQKQQPKLYGMPQQMIQPSSSQSQAKQYQFNVTINRSSVSSPINKFRYEEKSQGQQSEEPAIQPEPVPVVPVRHTRRRTQESPKHQLPKPQPATMQNPQPILHEPSSSTYTYTTHNLPIPSLLTSLGSLKLLHCLRPLGQLIKQIGKLGVWIEGDIYYGDFVDGRREGLGLEIYANEDYYYGYFKGDLYHGEGLYLWAETQYFFGNFEAGQKVEGRLEGNVKYQGEFKNNKRHGKGTCWYPSGEIYSGEWQNGKRHGSGFVIEPDGPKFVGIWNEGKRKGEGYLETDIMRIAGYWENERIVGESLIEYSNGDAFKGLTNQHLQRVQGSLISNRGQTFHGTFVDNQAKMGKLTYHNGDCYSGELLNMKRHGYGEYHYGSGSGQVCRGVWQEGDLVHRK